MTKKNSSSESISSIAKIFQEAQSNVATHRKNSNSLGKILETLPAEQFNEEFVRLLNMILVVKKKEPAVEKLIKFVITFLKGIQANNEKGNAFIGFLLRYLLFGTEAKEKMCRYRVCQLIALVLDTIEEIDDDICEKVKEKFLSRLGDKEMGVRMQSVYALSRLQGCADEGEEDPIVEKFKHLLQNDPSCDVRKAVLSNIEVTEETIPYIIERIQDPEPNIRKQVFKQNLQDIDFNYISIESREQILRIGLKDRDAVVKKACMEMVSENWIKKCDSNILLFLTKIDVIGSSNVAEDVLKAIFTLNSNLPFQFDDVFWENLTPESAILMRVFFECQDKENSKVEETLPEVFKFCYYIRSLLQRLESLDDDEDQAAYEFVIEQLFIMAKNFDYFDEVGRRSMFSLLKESFFIQDIPDSFIPLMIDVLSLVTDNETEFIRVLVEIISDIRMPLDATLNMTLDESQHERDLLVVRLKSKLERLQFEKNTAFEQKDLLKVASLKKEISDIEKEMAQLSKDTNAELHELTMVTNDSDLTVYQCLSITYHLLQHTNDPLINNPSLCGLLKDLILPNLKNPNPEILLLSLRSLSLCCILDKNLAKQYLNLFFECLEREQGDTKFILQSIFDLGMIHGINELINGSEQSEGFDEKTFFSTLRAYLHDEDSEMKCISIEGFCKWFLLGLTSDLECLADLINLYFLPINQTGVRAKQCLNYFFNSFSSSCIENQWLIQQVTLPCIETYCVNLKNDKTDQVTPLIMAMHLVSWSDSSNLCAKGRAQVKNVKTSPHVQLAHDILMKGLNEYQSVIKVLCQIIGKLKISSETENQTIKELRVLSKTFTTHLDDKTSINYLTKFSTSLQSLDKTPQISLDPSVVQNLQNLMGPEETLKETTNSRKKSVQEKEPTKRTTRRTQEEQLQQN